MIKFMPELYEAVQSSAPGRRKMAQRQSNRTGRGFTLVEILGITAIIAIIVYLVVVGYNGVYRSWATRNTIAAMKNVHLVLDKFRHEYGYFPVKSTSTAYPVPLSFYQSGHGNSKPFRYTTDGNFRVLGRQLVQQVHPYAREFTGGVIKVFDDFGPRDDVDGVHPIHYTYPYLTTGTFALFSKGKDGRWGREGFKNYDEDDIIYLPAGLELSDGVHLRPGFYLVRLNDSGVIQGSADDIEPLAQ